MIIIIWLFIFTNMLRLHLSAGALVFIFIILIFRQNQVHTAELKQNEEKKQYIKQPLLPTVFDCVMVFEFALFELLRQRDR